MSHKSTNEPSNKPSNKRIQDRSLACSAGLLWILMFVWSLPGTIALRYCLLLAASVSLLMASPVWRSCLSPCRQLSPIVWMGLLTLWLVIQAVFVSPEPAWALKEIKGQWITALWAGLLGMAIALSVQSEHARFKPGTLSLGFIMAMLTIILIAIGQSVWHRWMYGAFLYQSVPITGGKLELSFVANVLFVFCAVDLYSRLLGRCALFPLPVWGELMVLLTCLVANYFAGSRNGIIGMFLFSISLILLLLLDPAARPYRRKAVLAIGLLIAAMGVLSISNYRVDKRWNVLLASASVAMDIEHNLAWFNPTRYALPILANGQTIDASVYQRVAWMFAGTRVVQAHPLGVGYGRNAFRHAFRGQEDAEFGHAHSGFIDLAIGGGLPAVFLWLAGMGSLILIGLRQHVKAGNSYGLLLALITTSYVGRMALDSVNRDHMLQMFFFLTAYLFIHATSTAKDATEVSHYSPR